MTVMIAGDQLRTLGFGTAVQKAYSPLVVETKTLFTVAGGMCAITSLCGRVTTSITAANTVKLQSHPTTGTTKDICTATDIGTTDTVAGEILVVLLDAAAALAVGARGLKAGGGFVVETGTIEQVTATGADGGITWFLTYVPLNTGASIVAA